MFLHQTLITPLLAFAVGTAASVAFTADMPLIGPSFSANFDPSNSKAIRSAKAEFPGLMEGLFSAGTLNRTDLVFAVDVFSAATNKSLFNYYHVGEGQNVTLTCGDLNDKTIGRLGSVSKIFTVYAILAAAGMEVFSHPVTRYLPELAGNPSNDSLDRIIWEDVTVGALASQQAGSGGAGGWFSLFVPENS